MTENLHLLTLRPEQLAQHPDNVRDPGRDIAALAASIEKIGVLVPLIVVPVTQVDGTFDPQVTHVAVDGNRRHLAASQIGIALPCIVRADLASARETAVTMATTGLNRDGLTVAEEVRAIQTMLDLGVCMADISRTSGRKTRQIRAAKKAATLSAGTIDAATRYDLTLDQLAVLADWDGDDQAVASILEAAHDSGHIEHTVAQLTKDREARNAMADLAAELAGEGIHIIDTRPSHYQAPYRLDSLVTATGEPVEAEPHRECPGHAAYIDVNYQGEARADYCCTDPDAGQHAARYTRSNPGQAGGPMTDQQKADRQELIRRNKEMVAAQDVRRAFIRTVIDGRKHTKAISAWALERIIHRDHTVARWLGEWANPKVIGDLLGTEQPDQLCREAPPTRHAVLLWVQVVSAYEAEWCKDVWRTEDRPRTEYLAHLVSIGYTPCETEQLMLNRLTTQD